MYNSMDTAPKDGTRILAWDILSKIWFIVAWLENNDYYYYKWKTRYGWCIVDSVEEKRNSYLVVNPLCWTNLPEAPDLKGE
jgi:hypothetical protein